MLEAGERFGPDARPRHLCPSPGSPPTPQLAVQLRLSEPQFLISQLRIIIIIRRTPTNGTHLRFVGEDEMS